MSDVTVHIDETLDASSFHTLQDHLSHIAGVHGIHASDKNLHLMVVKYDEQSMTSNTILDACKTHGLHAELIGF